jgi:hypothetical protein
MIEKLPINRPDCEEILLCQDLWAFIEQEI